MLLYSGGFIRHYLSLFLFLNWVIFLPLTNSMFRSVTSLSVCPYNPASYIYCCRVLIHVAKHQVIENSSELFGL